MQRLLVLLVLLIYSGSLPAADYYVSSTAQAGGDGSLARPFRSLSQVAFVAAEDDTIYLMSGGPGTFHDGTIRLKAGQKQRPKESASIYRRLPGWTGE